MALSTVFRGGFLLGFVVLVTLWSSVVSLSVTASSKCLSTCGGRIGTSDDDLICSDSDYTSTEAGKNMTKCLLCESTSTAYDTYIDNDVYWFLFNQKFTIQVCLFGNKAEDTLAPCESQCLPLRPLYQTLWRLGNNTRAPLYDYCDSNGNALDKYGEGCASCLKKQDESEVLGNFMNNMISGCATKPNATEGQTVDVKELFPEAETGSSGLSTGAAAGIGVGVGVGGLILIGLAVWFFCMRRKKQREAKYTQAPAPDANWDTGTPEPPVEAPKAELHNNSYPQELAAPYRQDQPKVELSGQPRVELP